jgi:hypothetical protein
MFRIFFLESLKLIIFMNFIFDIELKNVFKENLLSFFKSKFEELWVKS